MPEIECTAWKQSETAPNSDYLLSDPQQRTQKNYIRNSIAPRCNRPPHSIVYTHINFQNISCGCADRNPIIIGHKVDMRAQYTVMWCAFLFI